MTGHLFFLLVWWMWVGDTDRNSDPPVDTLVTTSCFSAYKLLWVLRNLVKSLEYMKKKHHLLRNFGYRNWWGFNFYTYYPPKPLVATPHPCWQTSTCPILWHGSCQDCSPVGHSMDVRTMAAATQRFPISSPDHSNNSRFGSGPRSLHNACPDMWLKCRGQFLL